MDDDPLIRFPLQSFHRLPCGMVHQIGRKKAAYQGGACLRNLARSISIFADGDSAIPYLYHPGRLGVLYRNILQYR